MAGIAGVMLAALAMHWVRYGASHMDVDASVTSYMGLSQHLVRATDQVWSRLNGWASEPDCTAAWKKTRKVDTFSRVAYLSAAFAGPENLKYLTSQERADLAVVQRLRNVADKTCGDTHIHEFGLFYARVAELISPLAGFALFLVLARPKPARRLWIPLAILAATLLLPRWQHDDEITRASLVAVAMIGSLVLFPDAKRREDAI